MLTDLVAMAANSHEKVVGFNITMNEVLVVNVLHTTNHLHTRHLLILLQFITKNFV